MRRLCAEWPLCRGCANNSPLAIIMHLARLSHHCLQRYFFPSACRRPWATTPPTGQASSTPRARPSGMPVSDGCQLLPILLPIFLPILLHMLLCTRRETWHGCLRCRAAAAGCCLWGSTWSRVADAYCCCAWPSAHDDFATICTLLATAAHFTGVLLVALVRAVQGRRRRARARSR